MVLPVPRRTSRHRLEKLLQKGHEPIYNRADKEKLSVGNTLSFAG